MPVGLAQQLAGRRRVLAVDAGQPLHERPELVLAEQAEDLGAVVVAEARRLEVELDGRVPVDGHELAPQQDVVAVLAAASRAACPA